MVGAEAHLCSSEEASLQAGRTGPEEDSLDLTAAAVVRSHLADTVHRSPVHNPRLLHIDLDRSHRRYRIVVGAEAAHCSAAVRVQPGKARGAGAFVGQEEGPGKGVVPRIRLGRPCYRTAQGFTELSSQCVRSGGLPLGLEGDAVSFKSTLGKPLLPVHRQLSQIALRCGQ